jgi:hypothetical protein
MFRAHESSARLAGDLFAMGRSAGLRVVAKAQLLTDFERSAEGARVLDNAATVLLVRQAGGPAVEAAARRYGLSAEEQRFLRDVAQRGDGILVTPRGRVALHVEPSPVALAWLPPAPGAPGGPGEAATNGAATAAAGAAPPERDAIAVAG